MAVASMERSCAASAKVLAIVSGGLDDWKPTKWRDFWGEKCEKGSVMKENGIYGVGGKDL